MASPLPSPSASSRPVARATELILPVGLIAGLLVIFIPLPAAIIDVLLVGSITLSVIVLLTTIYIRTPLEFNIFPSLLLAATLGRLVLNIATTRLILTQAEYDGARAAGGVIESFGNFVAGGNVVVKYIEKNGTVGPVAEFKDESVITGHARTVVFSGCHPLRAMGSAA